MMPAEDIIAYAVSFGTVGIVILVLAAWLLWPRRKPDDLSDIYETPRRRTIEDIAREAQR